MNKNPVVELWNLLRKANPEVQFDAKSFQEAAAELEKPVAVDFPGLEKPCTGECPHCHDGLCKGEELPCMYSHGCCCAQEYLNRSESIWAGRSGP